MTFSSVTDLSGERKPRRMPSRLLEPLELRILGSLAEKQMSTPEYYPLTVNALIAACNQKSNREPVMEVAEADVQHALDVLQEEKLVWKLVGGRAVRWEHNLEAAFQLDHAAKAIMTLLFLRGPQTPGELRGRSDRLHPFATIAEVEETLQRLAASPDALTRELPRRPGQKESRWTEVLSGVAAAAPATEGGGASTESLQQRVQRLEEELRALKAKLGV